MATMTARVYPAVSRTRPDAIALPSLVTFGPTHTRSARGTIDIDSKWSKRVRPMRAVIIYESMYGNTHLVADAIGTGLRPAFDVSVVPVSEADSALLADADLVVVGGPTHVHGMSRAATRKGAVEAAKKPERIGLGLKVEPDALGLGLREWFDSLGHYAVNAAAFDTRVHAPAALTGRASRGVSRSLRAHGFDVVTEPESFLVTKADALEPGESARAREWGARLAAQIAQN
jgi:Flavodoxin